MTITTILIAAWLLCGWVSWRVDVYWHRRSFGSRTILGDTYHVHPMLHYLLGPVAFASIVGAMILGGGKFGDHTNGREEGTQAGLFWTRRDKNVR